MQVTRPLVEQLLVIDGEYGDSYRAILTLTWIGDDKVYISGLKGELTRNDYKEFLSTLKERGVVQVERIRHGKRQTIYL